MLFNKVRIHLVIIIRFVTLGVGYALQYLDYMSKSVLRLGRRSLTLSYFEEHLYVDDNTPSRYSRGDFLLLLWVKEEVGLSACSAVTKAGWRLITGLYPLYQESSSSSWRAYKHGFFRAYMASILAPAGARF